MRRANYYRGVNLAPRKPQIDDPNKSTSQFLANLTAFMKASGLERIKLWVKFFQSFANDTIFITLPKRVSIIDIGFSVRTGFIPQALQTNRRWDRGMNPLLN